MSECANCDKVIKLSGPSICCDGCQSPIHPDCVGLSETDVVRTRARSRSVKVVCNTCNGNMSHFRDLKSLITSLKNEFSSTLNEFKMELNEKFAIFKQEINEKLSCNGGHNLGVGDVMEEVHLRQSKQQNLMVFGMPEQPATLERDAASAADATEVQLILQTCAPILDVSSAQSSRLGRLDASSVAPRPLRVTLGSANDVHTVIKNVSKLKQSTKYSKISLSFDRTPWQINAYKELKREFNQRRAAGQTNIALKYVRGTPKIVNLN